MINRRLLLDIEISNLFDNLPKLIYLILDDSAGKARLVFNDQGPIS